MLFWVSVTTDHAHFDRGRMFSPSTTRKELGRRNVLPMNLRSLAAFPAVRLASRHQISDTGMALTRCSVERKRAPYLCQVAFEIGL